MSFFELSIGSYGLFAAQQGLNVTLNNVTNSNTPGYSRQILTQKAGRPLPGAGIGMIGTGVNVTGIERVRNSYLDTKIWSQKPILGEYRMKSEQLSLVEGVFGEPSDVGFTKIFDGFFNSLDDLSKVPDGGEQKTAVMQTMKSFTQYYNTAAKSLEKYQRDLNFEVKNKVDEINIISRRLESLNKQIYQAELHGGGTANSLRDERELQIDRLSEIINVDTNEYEVTGPTGKTELRYSVKVNGQTLVDHYSSRELDIKIRTDKNNPEDVDGLYDIVWKDGLNFQMNDSNLSGELKGAIDMRDGNAGVSDGVNQEPYAYRGIPYYIQRLDNFVQEFAMHINEIYKEGVDADGKAGSFMFGFGDDVTMKGLQKSIDDAIAAAEKDAADAGNPPLTDGKKEEIRQSETTKFYKANFKASNFSVNQEILKDPSTIRTTKDLDKAPGGERPDPGAYGTKT